MVLSLIQEALSDALLLSARRMTDMQSPKHQAEEVQARSHQSHSDELVALEHPSRSRKCQIVPLSSFILGKALPSPALVVARWPYKDWSHT